MKTWFNRLNCLFQKIGPDHSWMYRNTCDLGIATCQFGCVDDISKLTLPVPDPASCKGMVLRGLQVLEDNATRGRPSESHQGHKDDARVPGLGSSTLQYWKEHLHH